MNIVLDGKAGVSLMSNRTVATTDATIFRIISFPRREVVRLAPSRSEGRAQRSVLTPM